MISLGVEANRLDEKLSQAVAAEDRRRIWESAASILRTHAPGEDKSTLALGYVQSGKTTSMSALCALAADNGYSIIVAILGTTNLLVDQNRLRLEQSLGFEEHNYRWISQSDVKGPATARVIGGWLAKGRVVFIPVIKNATQLKKVAAALGALEVAGKVRALIIDDEADQASLNTRPRDDAPSSTYAAIDSLRSALPGSLYVQYTATPYAPLLLAADDPLMPTSIEFLAPGQGYTGGKQFFIESADTVIRPIPFTDESGTKPIAALPQSLERALAAFVAGAAILYRDDPSSPPISMLVHATHRNDGQARYHFLLERFLEKARSQDQLPASSFGRLIQEERIRLEQQGVPLLDDEAFWDTVGLVLSEMALWLVNSASDVKKISWNYSPFHLLIGGNKLDRGFTVEGLTITYMNRKPSDQIDTLEQRARAFGYRKGLLPYCQVFASPRTIRLLQGIVHTEDDLRANLYDWIEQGGSVANWAAHVGLDLPVGAKPTRGNVISSLRAFNADGDWHSLRRPNLDAASLEANRQLVSNLGLLTAPHLDYGRLSFRTLQVPVSRLLADVLVPWQHSDMSPSWRHSEIIEHLRRHPNPDDLATVILMSKEGEDLTPRERSWVAETGFVNLFQGRDVDGRTEPRYEGDRLAGLRADDPHHVVLQLHYVARKGHPGVAMFTPAIHLGDRQLVRAEGALA